MDSFGSGRLSDEERPDRPNGTLTRVTKVRMSLDTDLLEDLLCAVMVVLFFFHKLLLGLNLI